MPDQKQTDTPVHPAIAAKWRKAMEQYVPSDGHVLNPSIEDAIRTKRLGVTESEAKEIASKHKK